MVAGYPWPDPLNPTRVGLTVPGRMVFGVACAATSMGKAVVMSAEARSESRDRRIGDVAHI